MRALHWAARRHNAAAAEEGCTIDYHIAHTVSARPSVRCRKNADRKPDSGPVTAFSALFASVPVALALTLGVIVEFDLSILWSVPLYALIGSLLMTAILLIGYAGASDDDL